MKKTFIHIAHTLKNVRGLDWIVLGIGLVIFGLFTLAAITKSSIWFDEAFGAYLTQFNFLDIARYTATDVHPPFYYWILKLWTDFFGTTELAFRSLSVFFGASAITFGFLLVKRLFGRKAAWVSLLLLVLSPMLIRYSQEARMYTLAATITLAATYVLTFAIHSKRRLPWVVYGVLVSLGMWTHYFTAVVWLGHWVWRAIVTRQTGARGKEFRKAFFTKNWILAHIVAVGLFLPWVPLMLVQLSAIQGNGFWISPIGTDSLPNYITNVLFYLDHDQATGWYAFALGIIIISLTVFAISLYNSFNKQQKQNYLLLIALAIVPVLILFICSLPPLRSSFVERYLIPSIIGFSLFAGVTLTLGMKHVRTIWRVILVGVLVVSMLFGIINVYYFGNYNKNSHTKVTTGDIVKEIQTRAKPGEPIIANTPWVFYEAVFYSTDNHPVYFIDADTQYLYGSLDMLKYNDQHKIKDLAAFAKEHAKIWYIGYAGDQPLTSPDASWNPIQKFSIFDQIDKKDSYKAVQYQTN